MFQDITNRKQQNIHFSVNKTIKTSNDYLKIIIHNANANTSLLMYVDANIFCAFITPHMTMMIAPMSLGDHAMMKQATWKEDWKRLPLTKQKVG